MLKVIKGFVFYLKSVSCSLIIMDDLATTNPYNYTGAEPWRGSAGATDFYTLILFTDQIVMTPKGKTANSTTLMIERRKIKDENEIKKGDTHVAGGVHQGIIINKTAASGLSLLIFNII